MYTHNKTEWKAESASPRHGVGVKEKEFNYTQYWRGFQELEGGWPRKIWKIPYKRIIRGPYAVGGGRTPHRRLTHAKSAGQHVSKSRPPKHTRPHGKHITWKNTRGRTRARALSCNNIFINSSPDGQTLIKIAQGGGCEHENQDMEFKGETA